MIKGDIDQLCHLARSAAAYELTCVAGRDALVLTLTEGKRTIFLDPGDRSALEAALGKGVPAPLSHPGLPPCTWNASAQTAAGVFEGSNIRVLLTEATQAAASTALVEQIAATVTRAKNGSAPLGGAIAKRLTPLFNDTWRSEGPPKTEVEVAREITLETIRVSFTEPSLATVYFTTGALFGGHLVEAWLDARGELEDCQLAG